MKHNSLAENIVLDIQNELSDLSGFSGWWDQIDEDTKNEIKNRLTTVVNENLKRDSMLLDSLNAKLDILTEESEEI